MARINQDKCTGCKQCLIFCADGAISYSEGKCTVDQSVCTECYICLRHTICPTGAFEPTELNTYIKQFQHVISDPAESHGIKKGVSGRGAQEVKTIDVTGRIKQGEISISIDMGRPGLGVYLRDVEKVAMALVEAGVEIPPGEKSPLGALMPDRTTGKLLPECLDYHFHSLIMEGTFASEQLPTVLKALQAVENKIETVFAVGLVMHVDENCYNKALDCLDELGIPKPHRGKVNVGLGRPLAADVKGRE
jgi:Fe-S-cluster-containing hydrogenase component 2